MTIHCLTNPKNFVKEAKKSSITYEYLDEAFKCIGKQKTSRMFKGKSSRGKVDSLSTATLDNWMLTFEYVKQNPNKPDNDPYQARSIEPTKEWYEYVNLIKKPISQQEVSSWEKLSLTKLGKIAPTYGITLGVANNKSLRNIRERMNEMVKRRQTYIWKSEQVDTTSDEKYDKEDFRMMNILKLQEIAKKYGIPSAHIKKDELITAILDAKDANFSEDIVNPYKKLNSKELKKIAKDRGFTRYNDLQRTELMKSLIEDDSRYVEKPDEPCTDDSTIYQCQELKKYELVASTGETFIIPVRADGYVNATRLCKAGNKNFAQWKVLESTQTLIQMLAENIGSSKESLLTVEQGRYGGSWIHPDLAMQLVQWVSPQFALQSSRWTRELAETGEVKLRRPTRPQISLTDMDIEAEEIEMEYSWTQYTNCLVLYIAYIGNGMVKIGSSDSKFIEREIKHTSSESIYPQFRMLKCYKISARPIEKTIQTLLDRYRVIFGVQKEIFKPPKTLKEFLKDIEILLQDNDLKMQNDILRKEIMELKLELAQLKCIHN